MTATEPSLHPTTATVLVVDDDDAIRQQVCDRLGSEGFHAITAADGREALDAVREYSPDLIVLDLGLPGLSGFEVLRRLHATSGPGIILLSGLGSESDRVLGLEMGADDYVTKPFSGRELSVRIRNMLRRTAAISEPDNHEYYAGTVGGVALEVDFVSRRVRLEGEEIPLRPREFDLLACFVQNPRRVLTKPQLLRMVWDAEVGWVGEATVTEHVRRLRRKLEVNGRAVDCIDTLWGVGYRFECDT